MGVLDTNRLEVELILKITKELLTAKAALIPVHSGGGRDITESCGLAERRKAAYPGSADSTTPVGSRRKDMPCSS
jgi:hypothetical protein